MEIEKRYFAYMTVTDFADKYGLKVVIQENETPPVDDLRFRAYFVPAAGEEKQIHIRYNGRSPTEAFCSLIRGIQFKDISVQPGVVIRIPRLSIPAHVLTELADGFAPPEGDEVGV